MAGAGKVITKIGEKVFGALGELPYAFGSKPITKGTIIGETGDDLTGSFRVIDDDFKDFDFTTDKGIIFEDVTVDVPKSMVMENTDSYFQQPLFDPESLISEAIKKEPTSKDSIGIIIRSLKESQLIPNDAGPDDIFDFAERIANSENDNVARIGGILMNPKAQMHYAEPMD